MKLFSDWLYVAPLSDGYAVDAADRISYRGTLITGRDGCVLAHHPTSSLLPYLPRDVFQGWLKVMEHHPASLLALQRVRAGNACVRQKALLLRWRTTRVKQATGTLCDWSRLAFDSIPDCGLRIGRCGGPPARKLCI
jgi:hypothetical protein